MSLENDIQDLTAAIREQTAVIAASMGAATTKTEKAVAKTEKVTSINTAKAKKPAAKKAKPEVDEDEGEESEVTYAQVEKAISTLAKTALPKGRKRAIEILADYDAKKGPQVDESHYPAILRDLDEAIEELSDDE